MDRFICRENIERYRRLLAQATDTAQRRQLIKLLAEEEAKEQSIGRIADPGVQS